MKKNLLKESARRELREHVYLNRMLLADIRRRIDVEINHKGGFKAIESKFPAFEAADMCRFCRGQKDWSYRKVAYLAYCLGFELKLIKK